MRNNILAFEVVALAFAAGPTYALTAPENQKLEYSSVQVREKIRDARTPQQYSELADFYQTRRRTFVRKASEEASEWARRKSGISPISEEWPAPTDEARNLYGYFLRQAAKAASNAARYSRLADEAAAR